MCGIVGIHNLSQNPPLEPAQLNAMLGMIRHRGPDQYGTYIFQDEQSGLAMGSTRLSIIDLSGGQQPIGNEEGTAWIVFNGEIYNYVELRPVLEQLGHQFQTDSDTEVILHAYEEYGPDCVNHLNGQFAFAIWDERKRRLFIARDRPGIRPVYYAVRDGVLFFASEMKAFFADGRVQPEIDPVALDQIFTFWSPIQPRTIFKDVFTLPPGHHMLVENGRIHITPYWQPTFPQAGMENGARLTLDEAAQQLRELLIDATQIRLRADVPVGAYLSGGLDSSSTAALVHHYTGNRLETFSIAFTDAAYDESEYQWQMAKHLGTHHNLITCSHEDIGRVFPHVIWHTETPIMRTSPAPLYLLSDLVHSHNFKVVLTGEGADEFLGGYNIFKEAKIRRFWARQPESALRPSLLHKLYPYISGLQNDAYLRKFFGQGLSDVDSPDYSHAIRWHNNGRTKRVFLPELRDAIPDLSPLDQIKLPDGFSEWSGLAQAQYLEITIFLAEYLLNSQGDRMGMAHSVEGRFPFLDHRVIEFAAQLLPHYKMRGLDEKHILKRAMRDLLPDEIWNRPKRPYRAPIHKSFFPDGKPMDWVAEVMSPAKVEDAGCFLPDAVQALAKKVERFGQLGETDDMTLAGVLSTQLVHQQFIADFRTAAPIDPAQDDIKLVDRRLLVAA